ncbi:MAG: tyrosine-type recombinase/integrase [Sulfuritalea sp.]|nr:tyrosine-type recombinase/integrase [Sulfuritalea sp.]
MQLTAIPNQVIPRPLSRDVFDVIPTWLETPEVAYEAWINRLPYRQSSREVWMTMFGKLCAWARANDIRLIDLTEEDIENFFTENELKKDHRYRYVRLVEKVFNHLYELDPSLSNNPGRGVAWSKRWFGENDPTSFLDHEDRQRLKHYLTQTCEVELSSAQMCAAPDPEWTDLRDRAIVAMIFGGGVKVGELKGMAVSCISPGEGWVNVPATGPVKEHKTRLVPFAWRIVQAWEARRRSLGLPGDVLFPTRRGINPRSQDGARMHSTTIHRSVRAVLDAAGVRATASAAGAAESAPRLCAQTLRNSFAAELFDQDGNRDHVIGLVTSYLGLANSDWVERMWSTYRRSRGEDDGFEGPSRASIAAVTP